MKVATVISSHPGSGQTTVLVNLASGLVRQGKRVLIGELGLSPKLHGWLGAATDTCLAANSAQILDNLQANICSSRLGMDFLTLAASDTDYLLGDSILPALKQLGYDYLLLHPATAGILQSLSRITDSMLVCTNLRYDNELLELQALQENLQAAGGKSRGISLIIPNRIDTREWDHNSGQLMALGEYFGFDKIADPIPT